MCGAQGGGGQACDLGRQIGLGPAGGPRVEGQQRKAVPSRPVQLRRRHRRDRSRHRRDPRHAPGRDGRRRRGQVARLPPVPHKCVFDPLTARDEAHPRAVPPDQRARRGLGCRVHAVDGEDARALAQRRLQPGLRVRGQRLQVDQRAGQVGLGRQVGQQVGFGHGRRGVMGHHRVPVQPEHPLRAAREEMPEGLIAAHGGGGGQQGHGARRAHRQPRRDGRADRAQMRGRVEGRADLVMQDRGPQRLQRGEQGRQVFGHPGRPLRAGGRGQPHRRAIRESRHERAGGRFGEQDRWQAREGQHLHHGGGAGKVVAQPGQPQIGHSHPLLT